MNNKDRSNHMTTAETEGLVSKNDVQRVCEELGLQDWTALSDATVSLDDATVIRDQLGHEALEIPAEEFRRGLEVELEHGVRFADANVTNNHPLLTGKIVIAHLKEMLDYYVRLRLAELEGDLFKALVRGDGPTMAMTYDRVLTARLELAQWESQRRQ